MASKFRQRFDSEGGEQFAAFGSQFALNLSMFAIILVAAAVLEPAQFARLTLANGYIMTLAMVFDLGLNQACLKLAIEKNEPKLIDFNIAVKAAIFVVSILIFIVTTLAVGPILEVVILTGAAGVAFWASTRIQEQYHRRFWRYARLNFALAGSRIVFAGLSLFTNSWVIIVMALHVVSQLPIHVTTLRSLFSKLTSSTKGTQLSELTALKRVAPPMFFHSLLYSSLPVICHTAIYLHSSTADAGAFGIVMLFLSGLALVAVTLRIYVLPQVLKGQLGAVDVFGLGKGSFHLVVGTFALVFLLGMIPLSQILLWFYGDRFPQIGNFMLIYFGAQAVTNAIGFYNMRALRKELIWISLAMSTLRVSLIAPMLWMPQLDSITIVTWSAIVLIGGELIAAALLTLAGRRPGQGFPDAEQADHPDEV